MSLPALRGRRLLPGSPTPKLCRTKKAVTTRGLDRTWALLMCKASPTSSGSLRRGCRCGPTSALMQPSLPRHHHLPDPARPRVVYSTADELDRKLSRQGRVGRDPVRCRSPTRPSLRIPRGYSASTQCGQNGCMVDVEMVADLCEWPAEPIEMDGSVDLVGGQAPAAHRYIVSVEDAADCASFDTKSVGQFVHGRSGLVSGDQLCDFLGVELPYPPGFGVLHGWRGRTCRVG